MTDYCRPSREVVALAASCGRKCRITHLWMRQAGLCSYCFQKMLLESTHAGKPNYATIDHKTPKSKGGTVTNSNAVAACLQCNSLKADRGHDEFLSLLHSIEE